MSAVSYPPGISVSVMTYNEAASLRVVVEQLREKLIELKLPFEIIIIDDGSTDGSSQIADQLAREYSEVRVVHHSENLGLGAVYREGFILPRFEYATLFPADGQFEARILTRFTERMQDADMVLGYIPEYNRNRGTVARLFSWGERFLIHLLFGSFPPFQGIMMFRRSLVDTIPLVSQGRGWIVQMELILRFKRKGYRIVNEPTGIRARISGRSKVNNLKCILSNLWQLLELRVKFNRGTRSPECTAKIQ